MRQKIGIVILSFLSFVWASPVAIAQSGIENISKDVSSRINQTVVISDTKSGALIEEVLQKPLTVDVAIHVALINNKSLQATLESWGIAKADFNKTRLPDNPLIGASVRFPKHDPTHGEDKNNVEFTVEQDFLSFVLFPLKSNLAGAELHKAQLEITKEVLDLAFETKNAFYTAQATKLIFSMRKKVLESAEASQELSERQFKAGNINELDLSAERSVFSEARLETLKAEAEFNEAKENLNRLMGIGGGDKNWQMEEELSEIEASEPSLEELRSSAMSQRLDLLIAKKEVESQKHALSLMRLGVLGHPEVGVSTEKDVDGGRVTGPTVKTDVPIYDLGQTDVSRAGAQLKRAEYRLAALENEIRSEIKIKYERLFSMRSIVEEYRNSMIPARTKVLDETQKHYNFMLLSVFHLIQAKQNEILARKQYIESLKDYWITRSDLERAISGKLPMGQRIEKAPKVEEPAKQTAPAHHYHGGSHE